MASLRKMRGKWYARVRKWDGIREKEILIPLRTESKVQALERLSRVKIYEKDIKSGIDFTFSWLNDEKKTMVRHLTISQAGDEFLKTRKGDGYEESTLRRNMISLEALMRITGKSFPVARINLDVIENFKTEYQSVHTKQGININLRLIKTFLNWCEAKSYIKRAPRFKSVKVPDTSPSYLTDREFAEIMALERLENFYKQVFMFHRETGLRLSEPYAGRLDGNWLIIDAGATKQKREHEIELTDRLIQTWRLMMTRYEEWINRGRNPRNFTGKLSKMFSWACNQAQVRNHKFHDLRHTFAVRMYLSTKDIYKVKELMGHSSVTTTEKYARFNMRRLASDFPSLKNYLDDVAARDKMPDIAIRDTHFRDTKISSSSE